MRAWTGVVMFVLAGTIGAAQSHEPRGTSGRKRANTEAVTVSGCLSVNPAARTYVLTTQPAGVGRVGGSVSNAPTTITYQLVGGDGLQQHVGDKIEVTGTTDPRSTVKAESESERSDPPRNAQQGDKKPKIETKTETDIRAQVLRVQKFRFLESNCKPTDTGR